MTEIDKHTGKRQAQQKKKLCQPDTLVSIGPRRIICFFLAIFLFFIFIFAVGFLYFFSQCWGTDCTTELLINAGRGNAGGWGGMVKWGQTSLVPWPLLPHSYSGLRFAFFKCATFKDYPEFLQLQSLNLIMLKDIISIAMLFYIVVINNVDEGK